MAFPDHRHRDAPALGPVGTAHLEQVHEIRIEEKADLERARLAIEIADGEAFVARAPEQEARAAQMDEIVRQLFLTSASRQVRIGEVAAQSCVVVPHRGAEQQGPHAINGEEELREMARVAVEQAMVAGKTGHGIAMGIEHGERVVVLERARHRLDLRGASRDRIARLLRVCAGDPGRRVRRRH